jgi:hypothetical protein
LSTQTQEPTIAELDSALYQMLDENEALQQKLDRTEGRRELGVQVERSQ